MPFLIEIVDWDKHYENNRTRELKELRWVPMPNSHDGDGYTQLIDHPNGAAHFGAWCALVEVASRCDVRGTLLRKGKIPHDPVSLERMTRIPASLWEEALPRFANIGWIKPYTIPQEGAGMSQGDAEIPQEGASPEGKKERRKEGIRAYASGQEEPPPTPSAQEEEPQEKTPLIDALRKVNPRLFATPQELEEVTGLEAVYTRTKVVATYRLWHRAKKVTDPFTWFLKYFPEWVKRLPPDPTPSPPPPSLQERLADAGEIDELECARSKRSAGLALTPEQEELLREADTSGPSSTEQAAAFPESADLEPKIDPDIF